MKYGTIGNTEIDAISALAVHLLKDLVRGENGDGYLVVEAPKFGLTLEIDQSIVATSLTAPGAIEMHLTHGAEPLKAVEFLTDVVKFRKKASKKAVPAEIVEALDILATYAKNRDPKPTDTWDEVHSTDSLPEDTAVDKASADMEREDQVQAEMVLLPNANAFAGLKGADKRAVIMEAFDRGILTRKDIAAALDCRLTYVQDTVARTLGARKAAK